MADRLAELVEVRLASAGVALVTLNLPRLRNAMTTELTSAWTVAMDEVTGDRSLRAVVVTGRSRADPHQADQGGTGPGLAGGFEGALQWEALAQPVTMATADIHEGIRARREHHPPAFEGS